MESNRHACCLIAIWGLFVCTFALSAENNNSRILYLPKRAFIEVISDIMGSSSDTGASKKGYASKTNGPNVTNQRIYDELEDSTSSKPGRSKRDSLFFLQKSLEIRENAYPYFREFNEHNQRPIV